MQRTEKETLCSRLLLCHTKALAWEHLLQGDWKSGCVPPTAPLSVSLPRSLLRSSSLLFSPMLSFGNYTKIIYFSRGARAGPQPLFPHLWAFTVVCSSIWRSLGGGWIVNIFFFETMVSDFRNMSPDSLVTQGRGMNSWNY